MDSHLLLPARPMATLDDYLAAGGGQAILRARKRGTAWVVDQLEAAGLRGRGGAGFPTATKWQSVAAGGSELGDRYVVANGAEGEPGTFKDRPLMRANPYQVLEGLAVAAMVVNAREAFIAVKASFAPEIAAIERALQEMADSDLWVTRPSRWWAAPRSTSSARRRHCSRSSRATTRCRAGCRPTFMACTPRRRKRDGRPALDRTRTRRRPARIRRS
jgi:hypothetical protein